MRRHERFRTAAAWAVPIVVAVVGSWIQLTISDDSNRKDYVAIAVGVLSQPPAERGSDGKRDPAREWAVKILGEYSPVAFTEAVGESLYDGIEMRPFVTRDGASYFVTPGHPDDSLRSVPAPYFPADQRNPKNSETESE